MKMKIVFNILTFVLFWTFSGATAQKFCPPLERSSKGRGMEIQCQFNGQDTDCFAYQHWPGTVAEYRCKPYHVVTRGSSYKNNHVMTCNNRGVWIGAYSYEMFICNLDCGKPAVNFQKFIAGSIPTEPNQWPWHATIFHYTKHNNKVEFKCGGSLIGLNVVMTAAHCVTSGNPTAILVVLASSSSDYYISGPHAQRFQVKRVIPKENFDPSTLLSDIALLVLDHEVTLTDFVLPVCLPQDPESNLILSNFGTQGEVVGFGYFDKTGTLSPVLRHAQLELQSPQKCADGLDYIPSSSQICAGFRIDPPAVCMGDSGGGLYFKSGPIGKEQYSVEGIVSFGDRAAHLRGSCRNFGIFTRVLHFRPWIDQQLDIINGEENIISAPPRQSVSPPLQSLLPPPANQNQIRATNSPITKVTHSPVIIRVTASPVGISTTTTTTSKSQIIYRTDPSPSQAPILVNTNVVHQESSVTNGNQLQLQALDLHNHYRAIHGAPPLRLSAQLNYDAQEWAESIVRRRSRLALIKGKNYGQNVYEFSITGGTVTPGEVIQKALDSWYQSKSSYDPSFPRHSSWTQLVWKASTELGIGLSEANGRTVVVAFYSPPGNVKTRSGSSKFYQENVQL